MPLRLVAAVFASLLIAALFRGASQAAPAASADAIDITSHVTYNIRPDQGPVRVSWNATITNNDPSTSSSGQGGFVQFYTSFTFPVLSDAKNLSAVSSSGTTLNVSTSPIPDAPLDAAAVRLGSPLFYGETYSLSLTYEVPEARRPSLLITPTYAFVPVVALGDHATVDVLLPPGQPWVSELGPAECSQDSSTFTCSGSDDIYLAALAEASRPDLTAKTSTEVTLREKRVQLSITHFQGEEAFAAHVKDLAISALPVIEDIYGVAYSGPETIDLAERGKVITLGYEGLALCSDSSCDIAVSPVADDYTVLHELAHLWSDLYSERWLAEGFAEYVAKETANRLPEDLVAGAPREWPQATVEMQLDDWGGVDTAVGLNSPEAEKEAAGYYRADRFLSFLGADTGLDALRRANQSIAAGGNPADSKSFMDALEVASGRNNDDLFQEWVFPQSLAPTLAARRQARDRYYAFSARAAEQSLSDTVPKRIAADLEAWRFDDALARLDEADESLNKYIDLKPALDALQTDAQAAGLTIEGRINESVEAWEFDETARHVEDAGDALALYRQAQEKVDAPRNLWEQLGMLGSDPHTDLEAAEAAFNTGDYEAASDAAASAINSVDDASDRATDRMLIVAGIAATFSLIILLGVWYTRMRDRRAGELR